MMMKQWQNLGLLVLGFWLFISPWAMDYPATHMVAAWGVLITGAVIAAFAIAEIYKVKLWEEWVTLLLGVWTLLSPWALAFNSYRAAAINTVIVGALVVILAVWELARDHAFDKMLHGGA